MLGRRILSGAVPLAAVAALLVAAPAGAATQTGLGTTLDVIVYPGIQSALETVAYVPPGASASAKATTAAPVTAATAVTITSGASVLGTCTIPVGDDECSTFLSALSAGEHSVTYVFDNGTDSVSFSGTLFSITVESLTVSLEWLDAGGHWVDGNGLGVPLPATLATEARCVVTNNSNVYGDLSSFTSTVTPSSGPSTSVPITGTLASG